MSVGLEYKSVDSTPSDRARSVEEGNGSVRYFMSELDRGI